MTNPTMTYGHADGYLTDCDDMTGWTETESGLTSALTVLNYDVFQIEGTMDAASDEYAQYVKDITDISASTFSNFTIHWKTSESSNGLGAKVMIDYSVDATDYYWALDDDGGVPQFDQEWHVTTGTLNTAKTVKRIIIYADDYPDATASGTDQVYFDFIMLHKGRFTFPFISSPSGGSLVELELGNKYAELHPPGMVGSHTQYMGLMTPVIRLAGTMDSATGWGTPPGQYLKYVWMHAHEDPWQWFTSDVINCKVLPYTFKIAQDSGVEAARRWSAKLGMYFKSSGAETQWKDNIEVLGHDWST